MKAAVFRGPRDVGFAEVPDHELRDGDVLIRVRACGICGSDLHTYREGLFPGLGRPTDQGLVLGHEFAGEIVEVRGDGQGWKVGDRVATTGMGGNAEYFRASARMLSMLAPMPPEISFEEAATTEPLATSVHGVNLADPKDSDTLVVMGAGIIGLGVVQAIRAVSSAKVIAVDLSDKRLDMAKSMGADITLNASRENAVEQILGSEGAEALSLIDAEVGTADAVFDCAGLTRDFTGTSVLQQALSIVKQNGKVVVVAVFEKNVDLDVNTVVRKGIQVLGSWAWTPAEFDQAAEMIRSGKIDRSPLISHRFPLEEASEAYETQLRAKDAIKVMITP